MKLWKSMTVVVALAVALAVGLSVAPAVSQQMGGTLVTKYGSAMKMKQALELGGKLNVHYKVECFRGPAWNRKLVWVEKFHNRVTTEGLNAYLTNTLKTIPGSVSWYVGLVGPTYGTATLVISGTTTATDSTNNPFISGDTGQPITIQGAGAGGADHNCTMTYSSSSVVTLSSAATNGTYQYLFGARLADTLSSHSPWTEINPYSGNRVAWTPGTVSAGSVSNSGSPAAFSINATSRVYGAFMSSVDTGTSGQLLGMGPFSSSRAVLSGDTLNVTITASIS
jgi:hypothetical protein